LPVYKLDPETSGYREGMSSGTKKELKLLLDIYYKSLSTIDRVVWNESQTNFGFIVFPSSSSCRLFANYSKFLNPLMTSQLGSTIGRFIEAMGSIYPLISQLTYSGYS
jgi:hypothetical protein